jgi:colanic acid biosynthesis glycosyl transferase WcaI
MAAWLTSRGHDVRVVTAPPYYPAWRVSENYRRSFYRVENGNSGLTPKVYRCPLWVPSKPRGVTRMLHLLSFALSSAPVMAIQAFWRPDVVFTVEPTFFAAPVALISATLSGAASWLHIQDFEVDAAFELGLLPSDGNVQAVAKGLERLFTRCFSRVSSISAKMVERLASRGLADNEVVLFPNWGDVECVKPALPGSDNGLRKELGLKDKIVLLYSGNMGVKQGLEMLAPLASSFVDDPRIHFVFCGDGSFRAQLEKQVAMWENVTMLPLQPVDKLNDLLNAADIHLLPQRRGAADLVMPSKLGGILSSGRPVIATADANTQVAYMVEGRGLVVPPGDSAALRAAALRLVESPELRATLGSAARNYAVKHLSKEQVLRQFEREMLNLVDPPSRQGEIQLAQSFRG